MEKEGEEKGEGGMERETGEIKKERKKGERETEERTIFAYIPTARLASSKPEVRTSI